MNDYFYYQWIQHYKYFLYFSCGAGPTDWKIISHIDYKIDIFEPLKNYSIIKPAYFLYSSQWECDFYVTMSEMSKLKNCFKSEWNAIFKTHRCAKLCKICAFCAKIFKKGNIFLVPSHFTVHANNLGNFLEKNTGFGAE